MKNIKCFELDFGDTNLITPNIEDIINWIKSDLIDLREEGELNYTISITMLTKKRYQICLNGNNSTTMNQSTKDKIIKLAEERFKYKKETDSLLYNDLVKKWMQLFMDGMEEVINNPVEYIEGVVSKEKQVLIDRLKELLPYHINPYNLGDMGEISSIINKL